MHKLSPVIGIEVHVELATKSKMFCGCRADHFGKKPNTQTCPVCLGLPGALPVPNRQAVDWTILIGLSLGATINHSSKFDRKHYFYPDLPKGYQISQYDEPLCTGGVIDTSAGPVAVTRVHLEEDTGKLQHRKLDGQSVSLVDFNRSGVPLVEIVSEPDITSSAQAKEYTKNLTRIIHSLGVSDADMEKGSMRLEANISWGMDLGYKVEVKNINSFNYLQKAIDYELTRQKKLLDSGQTPQQETRGYNEKKSATFSQRSKEEAQDYRYFPEPDIPPMEFTDEEIAKIRATLPESPDHIAQRWQKQYQIKPFQAKLLSGISYSNYVDQTFEIAVNEGVSPMEAANLIVNKKVDISQTTPAGTVAIIKSQASKISDTSKIGEWIDQAIADNPKAVSDYQAGKDTALQFLLGQVMKLSRGQADAQTVSSELKNRFS